MSPEQVEQLLARWNEELSEEERRRFGELRQQIQTEREDLLALSQLFRDAADAQQSMLALPAEAEALREMGARMREMAEMMPAFAEAEGIDEDVLARLMNLQGLSSDQQRELAQLQQQLQQLRAARQALATSPAEAQQQLSDILAQLQAQRAMQQMRGLDSYLQSQQQLFQQMQQRVADLREETEQAGPQELEEISQQQEELDPEALELARRVQELLQRRLSKMRERQAMLPPAPWTPPGRRQEAMPVEADTPEEDPEERPGPDLEALRRRLKGLEEQEDLDWWDLPVDAPAGSFTVEADERFANRDTRPTARPPADTSPRMPTPREMLMEHQDQLQQALTANSDELGGVQNQLTRMMSQLQQQMSGTGGMAQMLDSEGLHQALGMAAWAAMNPRDGPRVPQGILIGVGLGSFNTESADAALYRLPLHLRQRLMQGMQERGPEAYQALIDAYYRQLSEEVEE